MAGGRRCEQRTGATALADLLADAGASLAASTSANEVVVLRDERGGLAVDHHPLLGAGGVGVAPGWLALASARGISELRDEPALVTRATKRRLDVLYVPRRQRSIGGRRARELFLGTDGATWFVDPACAALVTADPGGGVAVRWRLPVAVAHHLDGVASSAGIARYVTALGPGAADGVLVEVDSGEVVATGLARPRSPRLHDSRLWLLESAVGSLAMVDRATGRRTSVAGVPAFARGLAFAGHLAFVGLPADGEVPGGIAVVDTRAGALLAEARVDGMAGVLDLQVLPHRAPALLDPDDPTGDLHPLIAARQP